MSVQQISDEDYDDVIKKSSVVVVDMYADWCGPCKKLAPIINSLSEKYYDIKFCKFDVDANAKKPEELNIQSIPTILIYKNGKLVSSIVGFASSVEIENHLKKIKDDNKSL